ncbi:MAG: M48 family metalloprotease [Cyanobacteria bacterium J06635_15]
MLLTPLMGRFMGKPSFQKFLWIGLSSAIATVLLSLSLVLLQQAGGMAQTRGPESSLPEPSRVELPAVVSGAAVDGARPKSESEAVASPADILDTEPVDSNGEIQLPPSSTESADPDDDSADAPANEDGDQEDQTGVPQTVDKVIDPNVIEPPVAANPFELSPTQELLLEADRLYLVGDFTAAEALYRQAKDPDWDGESIEPLPEAYADPEQLPPAGAFYWQEAIAGAAQNNENRTLVSLQLLVDEYPEFVPGHARYAEALIQYERPEEATDVMEAAVAQYPSHPDVLKAQAATYGARQQWLESAIAARQFSVLHPEHPDQPAMADLAEQNMDRFRSELRERLQGNVVANVITGAVGYAITGGLYAPFTALNSSLLMLQGEQVVGDRVATQIRQVLPILNEAEVNDYVRGIGEKLALVAGRDEFDYQEYVVMDDSLNSFALPGGKIFINAGAILKTNSEAELAGLLAHEISHAVLSHGFQLATSGNLTASLAQYIPIPQLANLAAGAAITGYSRQMERQADIMGTQILASGDYAADGLHNLMITLQSESEGPLGPNWLASHPAPPERVDYLARLVEDGGYNRYQFEGIEQHTAIRVKVSMLLAAFERKQESLEGAQREG